MTGSWGPRFPVPVSTCSRMASGTRVARGAAIGEGSALTCQQLKNRVRKWERNEENRSKTIVIEQAIMVVSRNQWDSRAACTDF